MYNVKPLGARVIVKRKQKDSGGFHLSDELAREGHPDIGEIVSVGKIGFFNRYLRGIRPGKTVYYTQYSPIKIKDDERIMFVNIENILGLKISDRPGTID